MNWEEYWKNPAIKGEGFWTDVPYGPPALSEYHPTKGFIAVDGFRIAAIGHVWFPEQQGPGSHYFQFDNDARIAGEYHTHRIILSGAINNIDPILSDKLISLATSFREKHADNFARSLDRCVKGLLSLTGKKN